MRQFRLTDDELGISQYKSGEWIQIAKFNEPLDARQFLALKEGRYVEVTDTWLGSDQFHLRFLEFYSSQSLRALKVLEGLRLKMR